MHQCSVAKTSRLVFWARDAPNDRRSEIPLTNFRGIELRDFPAEIARLALIIAEYQCDVLYRGQKEALAEFLPLDSQNWITCGNALRLDWLGICPPTGTGVKVRGDDLFSTPLDQSEIDFENAGGETYICGNPPYIGATVQSPKGANDETKERLKKEAEARKADLEPLFSHLSNAWKSLDYVSGWFMKFVDYTRHASAQCAFVATNSICQGEQVARLWPLLMKSGQKINFAHTSFKWKNLDSRNAGVSVVIIGLSDNTLITKTIYSIDDAGFEIRKEVGNINSYLVANDDIVITASTKPLGALQPMTIGNKPVDGGHLVFSSAEAHDLRLDGAGEFIRSYMGAEEAINGKRRYCLWLDRSNVALAQHIPAVRSRLEGVEAFRAASSKELTQRGARTPFEFQQVRQNGSEAVLIVPSVSSENRDYLPVSLEEKGTIVSNAAFAVLDAELWTLSILVSRIHLIWIATVCGKMKTDFRYSNTLGWNTFPLPKLTEQNKADLTACAENILLAREAHFPATIADLYDPETMPENLRRAHEENDEVLERIYIGRRFKNDTERLEKLFELYTKMTAQGGRGKAA
ncbi:MAG: hypothetical protein K2X31_04145 [Sphingopyxis sp.]|nr:hypothetical protein [Sphingopyxis sp.]